MLFKICPRGWDCLSQGVGRCVPWGGTNCALLAGLLIVLGKVIILKRLVETDLHAWRISMYDVNNLLPQLRINESLAILVAIICTLAAKMSRQSIAYLGTGLARLHIFIDSSDTLSHCHFLSLLIKSALAILNGIRKNTRPQLILLWNLHANLMAKTSLCHLTIIFGAQCPPIWNFLVIKHSAKIVHFSTICKLLHDFSEILFVAYT